MSTTTSLTTTLVAPVMKGVAISENQCPMCWGEGFPQNGSGAHDRIQELEGQVQALTARASATAAKLSEYEDEIRRLRSSQPQGSYHTPRSSSSLGETPLPTRPFLTTTPNILRIPTTNIPQPPHKSSLSAPLPTRQRNTHNI
ncbi:GDPGTP exchange factor Sec2p [Penicillium expansum]|nr:GDPGTP exchange factor Sec2p [Penicillium expansum]